MGGKRGYSVATRLNERFVRQGKTISEADCKEIFNQNMHLLKSSQYAAGTWYDPDNDETYFDVVEIHKSKKAAMRSAKSKNEIGIFNLKACEFISTGGTGD